MSSIRAAIRAFVRLNACRDIGKILKLKIVCMDSKPTINLFTRAFPGVVVRDTLLEPRSGTQRYKGCCIRSYAGGDIMS